MTAFAYKLSFRAKQIVDSDRQKSAKSGHSLNKENPALARYSFHVEFSSSGAVLGEVTYSAGAANGLGISMSVVNGHSLISSGMWPSGYHSLGSISLASTVSLITS